MRILLALLTLPWGLLRAWAAVERAIRGPGHGDDMTGRR